MSHVYMACLKRLKRKEKKKKKRFTIYEEKGSQEKGEKGKGIRRERVRDKRSQGLASSQSQSSFAKERPLCRFYSKYSTAINGR